MSKITLKYWYWNIWRGLLNIENGIYYRHLSWCCMEVTNSSTVTALSCTALSWFLFSHHRVTACVGPAMPKHLCNAKHMLATLQFGVHSLCTSLTWEIHLLHTTGTSCHWRSVDIMQIHKHLRFYVAQSMINGGGSQIQCLFIGLCCN